MALVLNERVKETTTTTGTGALSLGGAPTGFETFAAGIGNSNTTYYAIFHSTADEFEVGLGTLDGDSSDLTRTTVYASSNSDSAVNFSSGTKTVFCTMPAARSVFLDADGDVTLAANLTVGGNLDVTGTFDLSDSNFTNAGDIQLDSISGDGDTNTKIEFSGSDVITMTTGGTAALTIDASQNVTVAGDLTVTGDDIVMGTNTAGNLLVADGTNFNSVAASSLSEIATVANDDVFLAVDTSGGGLKKITRSTLVSGLAIGGVALSNIVEDTTPQLGGNLDVLARTITTSTSNGNIAITPDGTGVVLIDGQVGIEAGIIDLKNSGSTVSKILFYCESSNAHAQTLIGAPHSESASNTLTLPSTGGNSRLLSAASTATLTNKTLTSPKINEDVAVTSTATELNVLDGITAVVGELNALDLGSTAVGTAVASKAVILDANKDYTGIRNLTVSGELDGATLDISGDADIDGTLEADAITVGGTALASVIAGTTVTLSSTVTVTDSTANTNFPVVFHDESNALLDDTGALRYNPSTGELLVPKLTVAGTTTTVDTVTMNAANAIIFEGATADAHETTLTIVDPTADRTINLPNVSGTIPVLAAASNTAITSTPAELNILDGVTSTAAELNILDGVTSTAAELNILDGVTSTAAEINALDGITAVVGELNALDIGSTAIGTAVASKAVILDANKDYTGIRNLTITGELDGATLDISGNADIDGTLESDAITIGGVSTDTLYASPGFAVAMAIAL